MSTTGLINVLLFSGLMVGAAYLMVWEFKRSDAQQARLDDEREKRAGESWD